MNEIKKYEVNLSKLGAEPAVNFNCRYSISYGTHGLAAVKHNYIKPTGTTFSVYDVYHNGEYIKSISTKKATNKFLEEFDKKLGGNETPSNEVYIIINEYCDRDYQGSDVCGIYYDEEKALQKAKTYAENEIKDSNYDESEISYHDNGRFQEINYSDGYYDNFKVVAHEIR